MRKGRAFASNCELSELKMDGTTTIQIQHYRAPYSGSGCFVHLSAFNAGDRAKIVKPSNADVESDGKDQAALRNHEFVVGECYLNIQDSNVIFCSHGALSLPKCATYLHKLFDASGIDPENYRFSLSAVADVDKLEVIKRHGVKSIDLSCSVFDMSRKMLPAAKNNWATQAYGGVSSVFSALFGKDDSIAEQKASEDLIVDLSVKLNGASHADVNAREHIDKMASEIVSVGKEAQQEFTITTMNNERLTSSDISFLKNVTVGRQNNSLDYGSVFEELSKFRTELEADNLLQQ